MATQLRLYNQALTLCKERHLASLTENREPRRLLDAAWADGFRRFVLEQGYWNFAIRTAQIEVDADVTPEFGYSNAFSKPTDWVNTAGISADERFSDPLEGYRDERGYWYSDVDPLFVSYVSDDSAYGNDLSLWPETFTQYAEAVLAHRIAGPLKRSDADMLALEKLAARRLTVAKSKDAMNNPAGRPPVGSWVRARTSGGSGRWDRGSRSRLIG